MLRTPKTLILLSMGIALAIPDAANAQAPEAPQSTIWSFLGVPQAYRYLRDGTANRGGNRPALERKPPLKAIGDPANLKSENPAIKKAAEVKKAEDEAKQKIKAVKYLAQIGCGCYNKDGSITDALLAALDDCTEEVRYEAINAIADAARGEFCEHCKMRSCCNDEISKKLYELAYERDDDGCFLEPSERVRQAAANALRICCPGHGEEFGEPTREIPEIPRERIENEASPLLEGLPSPDQPAESSRLRTTPAVPDGSTPDASNSDASTPPAPPRPPRPVIPHGQSSSRRTSNPHVAEQYATRASATATAGETAPTNAPPAGSEVNPRAVSAAHRHHLQDGGHPTAPQRGSRVAGYVAEEGVVSQVDRTRGLVVIQLENGGKVPLGQRIAVYHTFALTGSTLLGEVEVVHCLEGVAVGQALDGMRVARVAVGDRTETVR